MLLRESGDAALIVDVDRKNRTRLKEILAASGWPPRSRVGNAGATFVVFKFLKFGFDGIERHVVEVAKIAAIAIAIVR